MRIPQAIKVLAWLCPVLVTWGASCSGSDTSTGTTGSGGTNSGASSSNGFLDTGSTGTSTPCTGLQCQIHDCGSPDVTTKISGYIYDPAGKNPLYGVVAYVPNSPPQDFAPGASCYSCGDLYSGDPIAAGVTNAAGYFEIKNAPDGDMIPLVIQVGKWRRQFVIPNVGKCMETKTMDHTLLLPNKDKSNGGPGDMPNMAISTGSADTLECLLSRIGVDKSEYTAGPGGTGHIHIFKGDNGAPDTSPGAPDPAASLWDAPPPNTPADIMKYDIVLLSCEGHETDKMDQQVLFDYAAAGGRVFASHFHYAWFNTGPFATANLATWTTGSNNIGDINANVVTMLPNNTQFVRGQAMFDWLNNVHALTAGELPIQAARHNADVSASNTPSQPWIVADNAAPNPGATQDFTFDTPLNTTPDKQCGRIAFSDMHVGAASGDYNNNNKTPAGCTDQDLSPQEKALEFIFFDLSSCVTPNNMPMQPPGNPPS